MTQSDNSDTKVSNAITVNCPNCKATVEWTDRYPERPFCSKRCKDADFIGWVNEDRRIEGSTQYADLFSDESGGDSIH